MESIPCGPTTNGCPTASQSGRVCTNPRVRASRSLPAARAVRTSTSPARVGSCPAATRICRLRKVFANPGKNSPNDEWFLRNEDWFDLNKRSVNDILADRRWFELAGSWRNSSAPRICYKICGIPAQSDFNHINEARGRDRTTVSLAKQANLAPGAP